MPEPRFYLLGPSFPLSHAQSFSFSQSIIVLFLEQEKFFVLWVFLLSYCKFSLTCTGLTGVRQTFQFVSVFEQKYFSPLLRRHVLRSLPRNPEFSETLEL